LYYDFMPSCWLGDGKGVRPVKIAPAVRKGYLGYIWPVKQKLLHINWICHEVV